MQSVSRVTLILCCAWAISLLYGEMVAFWLPLHACSWPSVYDVTPYVEEHPGGDAILTHAGDDSTEGFYGPQHATRVFDMVDEFYVGDLKQ